MKKIGLFLFTSIIFIFSCKNQETQSLNENILTLSDSLVVGLDTETNLHTKTLYQHEEKGKEYLVLNNENKRQLQFYNVKTGDLEQVTPVRSEGIHKIPLYYGFKIISKDSIIIPADNNIVYLINGKGEILSKIDINKIPNFTPYIPILALSRFYTPILTVNDKIYAQQPTGVV